MKGPFFDKREKRSGQGSGDFYFKKKRPTLPEKRNIPLPDEKKGEK